MQIRSPRHHLQPVEVVDFILRAADHASRDAFGRGLTGEGVQILDPFTGTGTFMTRLLQSGLITANDLARKYAGELHANEIMLLAYYIAAVNIESTYRALIGKEAAAEYQPSEGVVLADTFQIREDGDSMDAVMFPQNNDRIVRQNSIPINVVVGNPPCSVGRPNEQSRYSWVRCGCVTGHERQALIRSCVGRKRSSSSSVNVISSFTLSAWLGALYARRLVSGAWL